MNTPVHRIEHFHALLWGDLRAEHFRHDSNFVAADTALLAWGNKRSVLQGIRVGTDVFNKEDKTDIYSVNIVILINT